MKQIRLSVYAKALDKSAKAWHIMTQMVHIPLVHFLRKNINLLNKNESKNVMRSHDFLPMLLPATQILTRKKVATSSNIKRLMTKVRKIRNQLAHHLDLLKRNDKTYFDYAKVWGRVLKLIDADARFQTSMITAINRSDYH